MITIFNNKGNNIGSEDLNLGRSVDGMTLLSAFDIGRIKAKHPDAVRLVLEISDAYIDIAL